MLWLMTALKAYSSLHYYHFLKQKYIAVVWTRITAKSKADHHKTYDTVTTLKMLNVSDK